MMKARRNKRFTSSGVALVATSKSFGLMPNNRSRTAPPTTKALKPACCKVLVTLTALDDKSDGLIACCLGPSTRGEVLLGAACAPPNRRRINLLIIK